MPETTIQLKGPVAVVALVAVVVWIAVRALVHPTVDPDVLERIRLQLKAEHIGVDVGQLRRDLESGQSPQELERRVSSLLTRTVEIDDVRVGRPLVPAALTSSEEVVLQVRYRVTEAGGEARSLTTYYKATKSAWFGWMLGVETTALSYYLTLF